MSKRICSHCGSGRLRRINRNGWMQQRLLPVLGYFPWECIMCRSRLFCRDNGHRPSSASHAAAHPQHFF